MSNKKPGTFGVALNLLWGGALGAIRMMVFDAQERAEFRAAIAVLKELENLHPLDVLNQAGRPLEFAAPEDVP